MSEAKESKAISFHVMLNEAQVKQAKVYKKTVAQDIMRLGGDFLTALTQDFLSNEKNHSISYLSDEPHLYPFGGDQGRTFWNEPENKKLENDFQKYLDSLELTQFLSILFSTKRPNVVAESALVLGDNWTATELVLLSRGTLVFPECKAFGTGSRAKPQEDAKPFHSPPLNVTMVYISGHLFASALDRTPDLQSMTKIQETKAGLKLDEIDPEKFFQAYQDKLLPTLKFLEKNSAEKRVLFALPGLGAGYFKGQFSEKTIKANLENAIKRLMRENRHLFPHVDMVIDFWDERQPAAEQFITNKSLDSGNTLYTFSSKKIVLDPISTMEQYTEAFKKSLKPNFNNHSLAVGVAADPIALPGAELLNAKKRQEAFDTVVDKSVVRDLFTSTDEPAKTRDTNVAGLLYGQGQYLKDEKKKRGAFMPVDGNSWYEVIQANHVTLRCDDNFLVSDDKNDFSELQEVKGKSEEGDKSLDIYFAYDGLQAAKCRAVNVFMKLIGPLGFEPIFKNTPGAVNAEYGFGVIEKAVADDKSPRKDAWEWAKQTTSQGHNAAKIALDITLCIGKILRTDLNNTPKKISAGLVLTLKKKVGDTINKILTSKDTRIETLKGNLALLRQYFQFFQACDYALDNKNYQDLKQKLQEFLQESAEGNRVANLGKQLEQSTQKKSTSNKKEYKSFLPPVEAKAEGDLSKSALQQRGFFAALPLETKLAVSVLASATVEGISLAILWNVGTSGNDVGWNYITRLPDSSSVSDVLASSSFVYPAVFLLMSLAIYSYMADNKIAHKTDNLPPSSGEQTSVRSPLTT